MRKRYFLLLVPVIALAGFGVACAVVPGEHESSACATASATAPGVTTPDHLIGADGTPVYTFPGVTTPGTSDVQTGCVTATATDTSTTVPGPTTTVTVTTPPPPNFLFDDEFNGAAGAPPDASKWYVYGGSSPPKFGVECFVNDAAHISQDGNGNLVLTATYNPGGVPCTNGSGLYESGGMHTGDETQVHKFAYKYGTAEARIKVPCGSGSNGPWPTWWESGVAPGKPWPQDGEIDNMEMGKDKPMAAQQTLHGPTSTGGSYQLNYIGAVMDCNTFHTYASIWSAGKIQFTVDGVVVKTYTPADVPSGGIWPFDASGELQQLILGLQVGASGGTIDNASLPKSEVIDWVRVSP